MAYTCSSQLHARPQVIAPGFSPFAFSVRDMSFKILFLFYILPLLKKVGRDCVILELSTFGKRSWELKLFFCLLSNSSNQTLCPFVNLTQCGLMLKALLRLEKQSLLEGCCQEGTRQTNWQGTGPLTIQMVSVDCKAAMMKKVVWCIFFYNVLLYFKQDARWYHCGVHF